MTKNPARPESETDAASLAGEQERPGKGRNLSRFPLGDGKLLELLDNCPSIAFIKDTEGRYLFVNKRYEDYFNVRRADVLGKTADDLHPKWMAEKVRTDEEEILKSGRTLEIEEVVVRDGRRRDFLGNKFPLLDREGRICGVCGMGIDITHRKKTKKRHLESEERYRRLFSRARDALLLVDSDSGEILDVNPAAESIYGYPRQRLTAMRDVDLSCRPGDFRSTAEEKNGAVVRYHKREDGTIFPVEITSSAFNLDGRRVHLAAIRDNTERIMSQSVLERAQEELERRVEERTRELSQANLRLTAEIGERRRSQNLMRLQRDLGIALSYASDLNEALELSLSAILGIQDVECGTIQLRDEKGDSFSLVHHVGLSPEFVSCMSKLEGDSPAARLILSGTPSHFTASGMNDPKREYRVNEGLKAICMLPLSHENRIMGALFAGSRSCERFDENARDALEALAAQIGSAISRITMELALRRVSQERERYRQNLSAIFRSIPDAIITVDRHLHVVELNAAFEELCNVRRGEVVGKPFSSLPEACQGLCRESLDHTLATRKGIKEKRGNFELASGPRLVVVISTAPFFDEENRFAGAVLIIRDITRLAELEQRLLDTRSYRNIIGKSDAMQRVFTMLSQLADHDTTALLMGESGTGKELVAEALHYESRRSKGPLVKVNCTALSESLLESELFGHVRGAFTGAYKDKIGRFQAAEGGTIFLDEIGDISPRLQLKLLRFLEQREFERVGETKTRKANVRVVAATNVDLTEKVRLGEFREDLYYRLKVMVIKLPPLRERKEDIPLLIDHFVAQFRKSLGKDLRGVSEEALERLMRHDWPGNVRELKHAVEHAAILCQGGYLSQEHLPNDLRGSAEPAPTRKSEDSGTVDREALQSALEQTRWNKSRAAKLLGISRRTLYRKLEQFGLD